jgi:hypothetical protein
MSFEKHPRLMLVIAMLCVVIAWFGAMRLMAFLGVPQEIIIVTAPVSSVVVAVIFLYLGRNNLKGPKEAHVAQVQQLEDPIMVGGIQSPSPTTAAEAPSTESEDPYPIVEIEAPTPEPEVVMQMNEIKVPAAESQISGEHLRKDMSVTELQESNLGIATEVALAHPTPQTPIVADEIPTSVKKVMNEIQKRVEVRCIVITAPSHGVLQDRLNNWLSGSYGRVVSTSMAMNEKGFFLTVFYEPYAV